MEVIFANKKITNEQKDHALKNISNEIINIKKEISSINDAEKCNNLIEKLLYLIAKELVYRYVEYEELVDKEIEVLYLGTVYNTSEFTINHSRAFFITKDRIRSYLDKEKNIKDILDTIGKCRTYLQTNGLSTINLNNYESKMINLPIS